LIASFKEEKLNNKSKRDSPKKKKNNQNKKRIIDVKFEVTDVN